MPAQPVSATSLRYRPRGYFGRHDLQTTLLTQVKGTVRRKALREALEDGQIMQVPDAIKSATLSEDVRQYVGGLHPSFMGGEYLPTVNKAEVEIARIRINSTTGDVTSVYARLVGQRIAYRVVDEYQGDTDRMAARAARHAAIHAVQTGSPACTIRLAYAPNRNAPLQEVWELGRQGKGYFDFGSMLARMPAGFPQNEQGNGVYTWDTLSSIQ
jgi:hypothetical protein